MIETGTRIAGYRIQRLLGSGGMGTVYLATQESLNRPVALKLLSPALTSDETFRARFRREGEVQAALDHPHIVPVYEAGETAEGLFLAMRFVRGSTLKDLVQDGDLDPARTLRLLTPIAAALDAAHAAGLIHRDVKPQNILVDQTDWPYLADFGLTRGGAGGPTRTGQLVGTFAYIAPEQVKGRRASARSDQYALAAVLFECLAGEVPHNHESDAALLYAKVHEDPPRLSQRTAAVPAVFDDVLARGMAIEPGDRYPSATALLAAATEALERANGAATRPVTVVAQPAPPPPPPPPPPPRAATPAPLPAATTSPAQDTVLLDPADVPVAAPAPVRTGAPRIARPGIAMPRLPVPGTRATAITAAVAAVAGLLLGGALAGGDEPAPARASVGDAGSIAVPAGMRAARGPAGLGLTSPQAYAQGAGARRRTLVVGTGRAAGPNLLPAGALADAARGAGVPSVVRAGGAQALRFSGLKVSGLRGTTQIVALPAGSAVIVGACAAPRTGDAACASALASLAPRGEARAAAVAASASYAEQAGALLAAYERARRSAAAQLRQAGRAATQAQAARRLNVVAAALAKGLRALPAPAPGARPAHDAVAAAATDLAAAAGRLAGAASSASTPRHRSAAAAVERADRALRRGVEQLGEVYRMP